MVECGPVSLSQLANACIRSASGTTQPAECLYSTWRGVATLQPVVCIPAESILSLSPPRQFVRIHTVVWGAGLEDMVLTPEQLAVLAEAAAPPPTVAGAEVDEVGTFQLQKGRLDVTDDGSTVIVRGGHDFDSETGTVTVSTPLEQGPDGLLTDSDGVVRPIPALLHAKWDRHACGAGIRPVAAM